MTFDIEKYSKVFERFLLRMAGITEFFTWEFQGIFSEIADLLRIGKIELFFYETPRHEQMNDGTRIVFYQSENVDEKRSISRREISGKGNVAVYKFYQREKTPDWTEVETEKIQVLASMIFTFNARARLLKFVEQATFYDHDLHIPNMGFFKKTLAELISRGKFSSYGVCFFNLKRFSLINQKLGRPLANQVIIKFMVQLQQRLAREGHVCRVGGDNFIILFDKNKQDIVVKYLQDTYITYDERNGERIQVRTSAGFYLISEYMKNLDEIIERAHMACQSARMSPVTSVVFYDEQLQTRKDHTNLIESLFRKAIEKEDFIVYYQPKVALDKYKLAGAEALCRWIHDGKLILPNDFIPILEQSQAICTLDFYILEHVCRDIRRWMDEGKQTVRVSVNLSRRNLGDTEFLNRIVKIIDNYNIPHNCIEIELTETTTDVDFKDLKDIVCGLHEAGIHTSIDDFGVGFSSINLIRQAPWDVVKIDKSFLPDHIDKNSSQYKMLRHLITMIQDMGLKCIVEGVENIEQVKMLKENHCYLAQGYYFDKPLTVNDFEKRLRDLDRIKEI